VAPGPGCKRTGKADFPSGRGSDLGHIGPYRFRRNGSLAHWPITRCGSAPPIRPCRLPQRPEQLTRLYPQLSIHHAKLELSHRERAARGEAIERDPQCAEYYLVTSKSLEAVATGKELVMSDCNLAGVQHSERD
jgi:hypothetical protein